MLQNDPEPIVVKLLGKFNSVTPIALNEPFPILVILLPKTISLKFGILPKAVSPIDCKLSWNTNLLHVKS